MDYRYGRKWDISYGSPRATFPPSTQTVTNYSPASQNIPPVQKIPAKIEFPPTSIFAGSFLPGWVTSDGPNRRALRLGDTF